VVTIQVYAVDDLAEEEGWREKTERAARDSCMSCGGRQIMGHGGISLVQIAVTCCCWVVHITHIMHHTPILAQLQCPRVLAARYSISPRVFILANHDSVTNIQPEEAEPQGHTYFLHFPAGISYL
jgi:hypothetical protein